MRLPDRMRGSTHYTRTCLYALYANARVHMHTHIKQAKAKAGEACPPPKLSPYNPPLFTPSHGVKGIKKMLRKVKFVPVT